MVDHVSATRTSNSAARPSSCRSLGSVRVRQRRTVSVPAAGVLAHDRSPGRVNVDQQPAPVGLARAWVIGPRSVRAVGMQVSTAAGSGSLGGRPRSRPDRIRADNANSSRAVHGHLRWRGITATIPNGLTSRPPESKRGRTCGRPPAFDRKAYKRRNIVDCCVNWLTHYRVIAPGTDKDRRVLSSRDRPRRTRQPSPTTTPPKSAARAGTPPSRRLHELGIDPPTCNP